MVTAPANRSLLTLAGAEAVTAIGSWVTMMAIFALLVFEGGGGVAQASGVFLVSLVPILILSPVAGAIVDRTDRRRVMIASQLLSGAVVVLLMLAPGQMLMYALLALLAAVSTLMTPARQAAVPQLVERADLTRANALLAQVAGVIKVLAPLFAGALLAVVTPQHAMAIDVVSYVVAAALLTRLPALPASGRAPAAAEPEAHPDATPEQPRVGLLDVLRGSPHLGLLFLTSFMAVLVVTGFDVLSTVVTRDVLGGDAKTFGILVALVGVGSVAASALLMRRPHGRDAWRDLLVGISVVGLLPVGMALAGLVHDPRLALALAAAGCLVGGLGNGVVMVQLPTLMQTLAPGAVLGRVSGLFQSTLVAAQLAAILATPLIVPAHATYEGFFGLMALGLLGVTLASAALLRRLGRGAPADAEGDAPAAAEAPATTTAPRLWGRRRLRRDELPATASATTAVAVEAALGHLTAHDFALDV